MRFPEFKDEWNIVKVSDLLEFYSTNSYSWDQLDFEVGEIFNLHYGMIHNGLPTMMNAKENILPFVKEKPKNYTICKEGDVAFADASEDTNEVAKCIEFTNCDRKQIICGLHTIHGRDKLGITELGYKGYAFSSKAFHDQVKKLAQGTKIYSISAKTFSECFVGIPSNKEQQKIAKLLSLIDKRIEIQRSAIEKLKSLKSAINDRLYDMYKGGITTSFSEFGESYSGLSGKTSADFGRGKPFITYLNVFQNDIVNPKMIDHVSIDDDENQNIVKQGDLLFTLSSETPEEVGYGAVYMDDKEIYLNSFCFGVHITRKDLIYSPYMSCLFSTRYFRKFMYPLAQGSTRYNLQKTDFEKKKISIPSLDFQKKIYKIVSALSSKIEEKSAFLSLYMNQKQYVLNKMFI